MAVAGTVDVLESALWPQGDARDPLGIWGFRAALTGDATGGSVKMTAQVPALKRSAYVYTCYSVTIARTVGSNVTTQGKLRLLTNWPNVDSQAGVQAYGSLQMGTIAGAPNFTAPNTGPFDQQMMEPNQRFLLLFDPRATGGAMSILELEIDDNTDLDQWSFEGYGYFWDRAVMQAPGGPRHPGAS